MRDGCSHHCVIPRSPSFLYIYIKYIYIYIYIYVYDLTVIVLIVLLVLFTSENLFQQPLHRRVPIDLFPCYIQRGSTWTGLVLESSASLLYLVEFQSSCMFLSPLEDLLLRLLPSSKQMFKWVDRVVLCPPIGSINVNWGLLFALAIVMHLSES